LFDLAASLAPNARRILSFGCSTGEELVALRQRFPRAEIVGAEINPRSRWIARRRVAHDARIVVVHPRCIDGIFDCVFALAVLQRQPHKVAEIGLENLSDHYPFSRFDSAVTDLVARLRSGGLLCVINAHYRVEDSSAAKQLEAVEGSPPTENQLFGPDGRLLKSGDAATIFRKRG
jgi:trans-aconitate methyltransferase